MDLFILLTAPNCFLYGSLVINYEPEIGALVPHRDCKMPVTVRIVTMSVSIGSGMLRAAGSWVRAGTTSKPQAKQELAADVHRPTSHLPADSARIR